MARIISELRSKLSKHIINAKSKSVDEKYVLFQSDDWGMERMVSKEVYVRLLKSGIPVDKNPYTRFDSFECNKDVSRLADVLSKYKDSRGNSPVFTINNVVGNPDYQKIKESDFQKYSYQSIEKTKNLYPDSDRVLDLFRSGIQHGVFEMAFHGREHLHITNWMKKLAEQNACYMKLFEVGMYSASLFESSNCTTDNLDAMAIFKREDEVNIGNMISEGLKVFEHLWGQKTKSFIAPCYTWDEIVEVYFLMFGVLGIQSGIGQKYPIKGTGKKRTIRRHSGHKNAQGQIYSVRNVSFEPSLSNINDWVNSALWEISNAFKWNVPAVIESHRINYISRISEKNSDNGLKLLTELLNAILKKWPEVIFIPTSEIYNIY